MRSRRTGRARLVGVGIALAVLTGGVWGPDSDMAGARAGRSSRPSRPGGPTALSVPEADCGPGDRPETGLQGQTTLAERWSGASEQASTCNLELVGQLAGEGASWQFAWFERCGYHGTANSPQQQRRGTVVVDASDPRAPRATAHLDDPAMLDPWESLRVNQGRRLLAGAGNESFALYDVSDCARPRLLSAIGVPGLRGHGGEFAPDGQTFYATSALRDWVAIDVSDPANPRPIFRWVPPAGGMHHPHDVSISSDGTRMYVGQAGLPLDPAQTMANGLMILDIGDIQHRRPNPQVRVVGTLYWRDGSTGQVPTPATIGGRPHVVFTDELGPGSVGPWGPIRACLQGLPPFGLARLIDISDERNPRLVSRLGLEVHDPANCPAVAWDNLGTNAFGYDSHYCSVDDRNDTRLVACSYFGAGVRVFDVSDPASPREVAYYKPPARRRAVRPGSSLYGINPLGDRTTDWASSNVRFLRTGDEHQLWFTSHDNGFQILRFTNQIGQISQAG